VTLAISPLNPYPASVMIGIILGAVSFKVEVFCFSSFATGLDRELKTKKYDRECPWKYAAMTVVPLAFVDRVSV
jgi:hypothetical protein